MRLSFWSPLVFLNGFSEITFNIAETASVIYIVLVCFFSLGLFICLVLVVLFSFIFKKKKISLGQILSVPAEFNTRAKDLNSDFFVCYYLVEMNIILLKLDCSLEEKWCALFFNPLHIIYHSPPFLNSNGPLPSLFPKTDDKLLYVVVVPFSN